ncbi:type VI secretion system baseplate subunit TssG [Mesorhizobium sp. PL10]
MKPELATTAPETLGDAPVGSKTPEPGLAGLQFIHFHQLVTLIEMRHAASRRVGSLGDPRDEHVRFRSTRSLSFGASDISEISQRETPDRVDIRVSFFGLYGPASPLPPHYTERIIEEGVAPSAVEDLLDLFNHRLISLLHVVWRKYRYFLRYEAGGTDALSKRFLALCGFPIEDRGRIGQISYSALLPHVGLMSLYSSSADVVAATISNFFDIPCRVEEFVPRRVAIEEKSRFQLGMMNSTLGEDGVLGFELDDDLGKFRICLGKADYARLEPFLPGSDRHAQMAELLLMVNREPLEWDILFAFEPETMPMARLGECRLGWSSWMHADDVDRLESTICLTTVETPSNTSANMPIPEGAIGGNP